MRAKIVLKQADCGTGDYVTLIRCCRNFEWECDSLSLIDNKGHYSMIVPMQNILYMEVLEDADSKS